MGGWAAGFLAPWLKKGWRERTGFSGFIGSNDIERRCASMSAETPLTLSAVAATWRRRPDVMRAATAHPRRACRWRSGAMLPAGSPPPASGLQPRLEASSVTDRDAAH